MRTSLVERIVGKQREWQAARSADFRDIVVQIADGEEPDDDLIGETMAKAGKSIDDLHKAVELLKRRRELREKWDSISELTARSQELQRQIEDANRELKAAEDKHEATVYPLDFDLQQLREATQEGEKAKVELWQTCTDPVLLDKLSDAQLRLTKRREEVSELQKRVECFRGLAASDRADALRHEKIIDGNGDAQVKMYLARAKGHDREAGEQDALLTKAKKIVAGLEREEAAIREQMLVP